MCCALPPPSLLNNNNSLSLSRLHSAYYYSLLFFSLLHPSSHCETRARIVDSLLTLAWLGQELAALCVWYPSWVLWVSLILVEDAGFFSIWKMKNGKINF